MTTRLGLVRYAISSPAAGADFVINCPAGKVWWVQYLQATFTASTQTVGSSQVATFVSSSSFTVPANPTGVVANIYAVDTTNGGHLGGGTAQVTSVTGTGPYTITVNATVTSTITGDTVVFAKPRYVEFSHADGTGEISRLITYVFTGNSTFSVPYNQAYLFNLGQADNASNVDTDIVSSGLFGANHNWGSVVPQLQPGMSLSSVTTNIQTLDQWSGICVGVVEMPQ